MLFKRQLGRILVVLAARSEDDPTLFQLLEIQLKFRESVPRAKLADLDSVEPVITDDTAPQCVVEIDDYTFFYTAAQCRYHVHGLLRKVRQRLSEKGIFVT